jgi:hypothetical protein
MEVSGQLHTPAALPPGKEALVPIGYEARWLHLVMKLKCMESYLHSSIYLRGVMLS